jgi:hypothetical protein
LTVADLIREQKLFSVDPRAMSAAVAAEMSEDHYDQAPLRDVPIRSYVKLDWLQGADGPAGAHGRPIPDALRLPETTPLLAALPRLREEEFLFATHREYVTGVVARADLGQPAVSMLALGMITAIEQAFDEIILAVHGESWLQLLSTGRRSEVAQVYERRRRTNTDLSRERALNLDDRLTLVRKAGVGIRQQLGFESSKGYRAAAEQLKGTRDCLAHGDGLLGALPDPIEALDELDRIRGLAERAEQAADGLAS